MPQNTNPKRLTYRYELSPYLRANRYLYEKFGEGSVAWLKIASSTGFPTLPTAAEDLSGVTLEGTTPGGNHVQAYCETDLAHIPVGSATGLAVMLDATLSDDNTIQLVPGANGTRAPFLFQLPSSTVTGDPSFFFRVRLKIADVSGTDNLFVGFRKQDAFAVSTGVETDGVYTDFAGFTVNAGNVKFVSDLNNSGTATVTDTLFDVADGGIVDLAVHVRGRRVIGFINGIRCGNPVAKDGDGTAITSQSTVSIPAFDFDAGDALVPTVIARQAADKTDIHIREWEAGFNVDAGRDKDQE